MAVFLLCPHRWKESELALRPLKRALIAFTRAPLSWSHHLPKVPPPNTIIVGVRVSTYELWGDRNIQFISLSRPHLSQRHHMLFSPKRQVSIASTKCDLPLLWVPVVLCTSLILTVHVPHPALQYCHLYIVNLTPFYIIN